MILHYRIADETDIPVIFAQAKRLIDDYEDLTSIDYDKVLTWMQRKISTHISQYQCVLLDNEKCAYYRLCADGELDDLYILQAFQNRGIGSEIVKKCIEESSENIYLYVFSENIRAISFYERFGFTVRQTLGKTRLIMDRNG